MDLGPNERHEMRADAGSTALREMRARWIAPMMAAVLALGMASGCFAAPKAVMPGTGPCRAVVPTTLTAQPVRWLGDCPSGAAEGFGVMRAGAAEPYQFFLGEMHLGLPVRGLLIGPDEDWEIATDFDASHAPTSPRSMEGQDTHALFELSERAARTTARRFAAAGNQGSAVYYEKLAQKIVDGEPE
jgi:hypothetical protein